MPIARTLDAYPQSAGNLSVVVVVDSSQPEFAFQFETTFGALSHLGLPFRVLDLADQTVSDDLLADCRAVIISQEHLGVRLGTDGAASLLRSLEAGAGLVNFDNDLTGYGNGWLEAAGLQGAGLGSEVLVD